MKGVVFNIFNDMINDQFGMETWQTLIDRTEPASDAVYTSGDVYPDEELLAYVAELSSITGVEVPKLVYAFGQYMMKTFARIHPEYLGSNPKAFLRSVHDVIHVEVKKLHPDAILPEFTYEDPAEDRLTMIYKSPRKLCYLAEGLIAGVAEQYDTPIAINHSQCMHDGAETCRLELRFG